MTQLKYFKPTSPGQRGRVVLVTEVGKIKKEPEKSLIVRIKKSPGRSGGKVTVRHKGGGARKFYRLVDFKREKFGVKARIEGLEYDPNRNVSLALLNYLDGEKRYILAPEGLKIGDLLEAGPKAPIRIGNALPLSKVSSGIFVHNLEITPGAGGKLVRSAGVAAQVLGKDESGKFVQVRLPSGEVKLFLATCLSTIGQLGNAGYRHTKFGKAGRIRHLGIRPTVRGVAQNPKSHPHGGGEGRSGIGMPNPKTPWGKLAFGVRTRRRSKTNKFLVLRRRK